MRVLQVGHVACVEMTFSVRRRNRDHHLSTKKRLETRPNREARPSTVRTRAIRLRSEIWFLYQDAGFLERGRDHQSGEEVCYFLYAEP